MAEPTEMDIDQSIERSKALWLKVGLACEAWAEGMLECLEDAASADEAMGLAARAEACFSRATGDDEAIGADLFLRELRTKDPTQ